MDDELHGIVGSRRFTALEVLEAAVPEAVKEIAMTLGGGDLEGGRTEIAQALTDILGGTLEPSRAYGYARATELVLDRVAEPLTEYAYEARTLRLRDREPRDVRVLTTAARASILWVQLTYSLPNDSFGRWNPVLVELGLPTLARLWAQPNVSFPWAELEVSRDPDWPIRTAIGPGELSAVAGELAGLSRERLNTLPPRLLVEESFAHLLDEMREELHRGLELLTRWVAAAVTRTGSSLLLIMDGDQ